jgi:hypothetical protein
MPQVLPIFPLYPSPTFLKYNVSLAIPGPKLWDLPKIGEFAKNNNYPNTQAAILIPDIEYIKRFANYELGIADSMLKAAQKQNISRIKSPEVRKSFDQLYGDSNKKTGSFADGLGLISIEKAILASIFETQKPYFEIAQFVIKSLSKIEDIIARICPLIGAATNPPLALAIKSRKPKGNGPQQNGILGPYGTPPALGYKNGEQVNKKLDGLKTQLQRGNGVKIDKNGKYTKLPKAVFPTNLVNSQNIESTNFDNIKFTYATISTIYSTGIFDPTKDYKYKYIDLPADEVLPPVVTPPEPEEVDDRPERIILGVFGKNGNPIDPLSKIEYWGTDVTGLDLEKKSSIFEKAPWIKGEKWILDKAIDKNGNKLNVVSWNSLDDKVYLWKKNGVERYSKTNPDPDNGGWEMIRYKDKINFTGDNEYLKFKENDFFVQVQPNDIGDYRDYYDYLTQKSLDKNKVPAEDRPEILSQIELLFSDKSKNDKILEQLQNLSKYGDFKNSYYTKIDTEDWKGFSQLNSPDDDIPGGIRRVFKPMRFNIGGEIMWIDPESEYDIKVIKVDPTLRLDYKTDAEKNDRVTERLGQNKSGRRKISGDDSKKFAIENLSKNSEIKKFIKNSFTIRVYDSPSESPSGEPQKFTAEIGNGVDVQKYTDITEHTLYNWNVNFNTSNGDKIVNQNTSYRYKLYFDKEIPKTLKSLVGVPYQNASGSYVVYSPDSEYDSGYSEKSKWAEPNEGFAKTFDDIGLGFIGGLIRKKVEATSLEKADTNLKSISKLGNDYVLDEVTYNYWKKTVINPVVLAEAVALTTAAIATVNPVLFIDAATKFDKAIDKFQYYTIDRVRSTEKSFLIPSSYCKDITLEISGGKIDKWIFLQEDLDSESIFKSGDSVNRILPKFYKSNVLNINITRGLNTNIVNNDIIYLKKYGKASIVTTELPKFQIQVFENGKKYKSITSENYNTRELLNNKIVDLNKLKLSFSKGRYGSSWKGGPAFDKDGKPIANDDGTPFIEPDNPQYLGYLRRSQLTELDLEPYYIIEGYKRVDNEKKERNTGAGTGTGAGAGAGTGAGAGGFYRMPDALGIIKVMIELTIELAIKLFPAINKLIALIKNPASFVTEIIKAKVEEHFIIFSPKVTKLMSDIENFKTKVKTATNYEDRDSLLKEMKTFVRSSELGNYIYVNEEAEYKFVIDGPALIGFFGILFGLDLNLTKAFNGGVPIKPIFSNVPSPGNLNSFFDKFRLNDKNPKNNKNSIYGGDNNSKTDNLTQTELEDKVIRNLDLTKPDEVVKNKIVSNNGNSEYYEEVSITYSTGKFIEGVDYKYIYLDQEVQKIILEADELVSKTSEIDYSGTASNPLDSLQIASEKYQQAYDLLDKNDKTKDTLKKLLLDKIKALKGKINIVSQPLFKLILGIVTLPLKVVFSIIKWLLDFFKKLVNPIKFPSLIVEFLSFKWIMDFFTPKGLLELAGIKFKPEKLIEWCVAVNVKNPLYGKVTGMGEYLIPDDFVIADLNEFLNVGFEAKLPVYTAKQYRDLCLRPFRLFSVFLCFIEKIINSFIMLIWSVMGITAVIPPPLLKLCKRLPENIDPKDLRDLMDGMYKDDDLSVVNPKLTTEDLKNTDKSTGSYDFIYEVKLPDGTTRKDLDRSAVQNIIDQNKGLNFDFLNFETLE